MPSSEACFVATRTAGGRRGGRLSGWHSADLGGARLNGLIARSSVAPAAIEDVILGCATQGEKQSSKSSAAPLAGLEVLGGDPARLNVNGGAITHGLPLGASGTKLMITLIYRSRRGPGPWPPGDVVKPAGSRTWPSSKRSSLTRNTP